jgi:hypothetical protein
MGDWKDKLKDLKRALSAPSSNGAKEETPRANRPQSPSTRPSRPATPTVARRYVCIGLDFGTSSTKAVTRLLDTGPAFAIPFEGIASAEHAYLAPTRLAVAPDGLLRLAVQNGSGWVEDLKVRLMEAPWTSAAAFQGAGVSARPVDLAAGYIALVLRKARSVSETLVRPSIGQAELVWSLNLGIPARDLDATSIKEAFLAVAMAGWQLAVDGGDIDLRAAAKAVELARDPSFRPRGIDRSAIDVVPEVAAGVTTYARSPARRTGAHLFVDVGATTLDTSLFLLTPSTDGLRYAFLAADVDPERGAFRLHRYRARELGRLALARYEASNPLRPIPIHAVDCVPPTDHIAAVDVAFQSECMKTIGKVAYTAKMKDPGLSVPDKGPAEPIQVLLSGGGIRLPLYQEAIWEYGRRAGPGGGLGLRLRPLQEAPIPRPADLRAESLADEDWQRLAIAYGLSFRSEDIGEFIPPSVIPPMPRQKPRDDGDPFVSKDLV